MTDVIVQAVLSVKVRSPHKTKKEINKPLHDSRMNPDKIGKMRRLFTRNYNVAFNYLLKRTAC